MTKDYSQYVAYALGDDIEITVTYLFECGWSIETNDDCDEFRSAVETMKRFKELCQQHKIKTVMVRDGYLDHDCLAKWDAERRAYDRESAYFDACLLHESTGDRSLLDRYEARYEE